MVFGEINRMYEKVKDRIKLHEGFVPKIYKDTLGFATIGYGHKVVDEDNFVEEKEYTKEELEETFLKDFDKAVNGAERLFNVNGCVDLHEEAKGIIIEMVFQLGPTGVSNFRNMWKCLSELNYVGASYEMIDSKWYKQTTNRAKQLSNHMKNIGV